ncbi:hypothetical protein LZ30DRAFT_761321 [Colletotrichum cereale]|nr:hypothetical protein LZ30DRAFT_761321 [Colletotrichum cereale]
MGSWGDTISRRADRMPSMRVQASTNKQQSSYSTDDSAKDAMMIRIPDNRKNDLGNIRIAELPLDDTPNPRALPQRPRRPPAITERSEALNGYLDMAEKGIDDAEAMAVKDLDDLGGPSVYRPMAGPTKDFVAEPRRPTTNFQGMQTSRNGILLPPGAVVHRFTHDKGVPENATAVSNTPVAVSGPRPGNTASTQAFKQPLPPHLRMKKKMEAPLSNKPGPENGTCVEATKPVAREITVRLPDPTAYKELRKNQSVGNESKQIQSSVTHTNTVKHDHNSEDNGSKDEVVIFWTGSCKTWVPEQGKDCVVMIDLKVINAAVGTEGQSLFVMALPEVFIKKHNMRSYLLEILKGNLCAVKFVNPDTGVEEGRYRLRFQDEMTATDFQGRAAVLQRVMGYLSDVAAASKDMGVEAGSANEQNATREQPRQFDLSVTAAPVEGSAKVPQQPKAAIEKSKSSAKAKDNGHTPNKSKDSLGIITDAFNNLSLNMVKDANMYKANRQRVRYSAEELLEQRSSGRAPSGITGVKIPLNRQDKQPRNTSSTQNVLESDRQSKKSLAVHDGAKLKDWIAGKQPQSKAEESSRISMPGLSEAVQYQKVAAVATEASAQASKGLSSESKPDNVLVDKIKAEADGTSKENKEGSASNETPMAATATGTDPNTSKSTDTGASIDPEVPVDQATPVVEASIYAEPKKSDGAAHSDASSDSAVGFQPSSRGECPSAIATNQNEKTKTDNSAPFFDMEVPAPAVAVIADEQDGSAKDIPAMLVETSAQTVPMGNPTANPRASFAVHPNTLYGFQGQSDQGMPSDMLVPHLASPQMPSPVVATPHMAQPHVAYTPQMHAHPMITGLQQYPPAGIVHAVSVTYHITHPGQPIGQPLNADQENVHTIHHVTDLIGQQTGRAFSPGAQVFKPQSQFQPSQQSSGQNRMRRGLESSIFATGYSGAKHAGSFTGAPPE